MGLRENFEIEPVSQLSLRDVVTIEPWATIRDAIGKMREKKLGCVIVVDADDKPIGMFTEAMLRYQLLRDPDMIDEKIETQMADQWPWVKLSDPISMVLEAMQSKHTRFVCVVDEEGKAVALTGQKGLMEYVAEHFPLQVMVQRIGCAPCTCEREGA